MYEIVDVEDVQVDLGLRSAYTSNADLNGTPTVDGQYRLSPKPTASATLADADVTQLAEFLLGISATTAATETAIGFGSSFEAIAAADVPTLFILPSSQSGAGVGANNGIWFTRTTISGLDGINFGRVDEGEIQQFYNVAFEAVYAATDQGANAIPAAARIAFMGPPAAFGLAWALA
jgi:hypothetical protein